MTMPFGKYKGFDLCDLPDDYIRWLSDRIDLRNPLRSAVQSEMDLRAGQGFQHYAAAPVIRVPAEDLGMFREVLERGFKSSALVHHPDHNGNPENMRRLSGLMGSLRSQLGALGAGA